MGLGFGLATEVINLGWILLSVLLNSIEVAQSIFLWEAGIDGGILGEHF